MVKLNGKVSDIFGDYLSNVYVALESGEQYDFDCDDVKDELISAINDGLALRETLRLKELECQQLAQDKAELVLLVTAGFKEALGVGYGIGLSDGQCYSSNKCNLDKDDEWYDSEAKQLLEKHK